MRTAESWCACWLLQFSSANGARSGVGKAVILASDGYSDVPEGAAPNNNAALLKNSGVKIYTVALSGQYKNPNIVDLGNISSGPSYQLTLDFNQTSSLQTTTNTLLNMICTTNSGWDDVTLKHVVVLHCCGVSVKLICSIYICSMFNEFQLDLYINLPLSRLKICDKNRFIRTYSYRQCSSGCLPGRHSRR